LKYIHLESVNCKEHPLNVYLLNNVLRVTESMTTYLTNEKQLKMQFQLLFVVVKQKRTPLKPKSVNSMIKVLQEGVLEYPLMTRLNIQSI